MQTDSLAGKVALVTGAARNLGRAYAIGLAEDGATVAVHYNRASSEPDARETQRQIEAAGGRASIFAADLTTAEGVESLFSQIRDELGSVDILVNNAGAILKKPFVEFTEEDYDSLFAINSKAVFLTMREAAKGMQDGGRIINLGTTLLAATTGFYGAYTGSKAPLEDFTRALAKEIGDRGVTVNTVAPGPVDTDFFQAAETPESVAFLSSQSVTGNLGAVEQIVPVIRFLASAQAGWITAQTIFVNGGFIAR